MLPARRGILAARVGQEILTADRAREVPPHVRVHRLYIDVGVVVRSARAARIRAAWNAADEAVAPALARLAIAVVIDIAAAQEVGHDLLHRHLHELALAGALTLDVGRHDRRRGVHTGPGVADGGAAAHGLAVGETGDAHHAAGRLRDHVEALVFRIRSGQAEAFDPRDDDARIGRAQSLVVEPQPLHQA